MLKDQSFGAGEGQRILIGLASRKDEVKLRCGRALVMSTFPSRGADKQWDVKDGTYSAHDA